MSIPESIAGQMVGAPRAQKNRRKFFAVFPKMVGF